MIYRDTTAIEAVNTGRGTPDAFYAKSTLMATSKWHATDGWRGYNVLTPEPGFKKVADDWVTGDYDDAPAGNAESEVEAKLLALEKQYGDVYVIYTPTSNVFSTGYDVLVRDPDTKPLKGKTIAGKTKRFDAPDGSFRIQYYATNIIRFDAARNVYTLNSGGWHTKTTKERINNALPSGYRISQKNFEWTLHTPDGERKFEDNMEVQA